MFTGFRARLMLSFALLLLACLTILTLTFTLFFFLRVSLPDLAYARLTDAAGPTVAHIRALRQDGKRFLDSIQELRDLARSRGMRFLLVGMPGGTVIVDTEDEWTGQRIRIALPSADSATASTYLRGRTRGPDQKWLFYVAVRLGAVQDT